MKTTHPALWGAGWAGIAVGGVLTLFGLTNPSDVAPVAGAYGLLLMGTGLFLFAGLKLRERLLEPGGVHPCAPRGRRPLAATAADGSLRRACLRSGRCARDREDDLLVLRRWQITAGQDEADRPRSAGGVSHGRPCRGSRWFDGERQRRRELALRGKDGVVVDQNHVVDALAT